MGIRPESQKSLIVRLMAAIETPGDLAEGEADRLLEDARVALNSAGGCVMTVRIEFRSVYGKDLIYPACENGRRFAKLTRRATFTLEDLRIIASLGFMISRVGGPGQSEIIDRLQGMVSRPGPLGIVVDAEDRDNG